MGDVPTVTTQAVTGLFSSNCVANGVITTQGDHIVTSRGFCYKVGWSIPNIVDDFEVHEDIGDITSYAFGIGGFAENSKISIRAYAINSDGVGYGETIYIRTPTQARVPNSDYLSYGRRDRMRNIGVSNGVSVDPSDIYVLTSSRSLSEITIPVLRGGLEIVYSNPVEASSFLNMNSYVNPLFESDGRLWAAGSDYSQITFNRTFSSDNKNILLLMNKGKLNVYF